MKASTRKLSEKVKTHSLSHQLLAILWLSCRHCLALIHKSAGPRFALVHIMLCMLLAMLSFRVLILRLVSQLAIDEREQPSVTRF